MATTYPSQPISEPSERLAAASDEQSSNQKLDDTIDWPMPDGYLQRLQTGHFTVNDLAWQAHNVATKPTAAEEKALADLAVLDRQTHALRKKVERLQADRGVAKPSTTGTTWEDRLSAIGTMAIPPSQDLLLGFLHPTAHTIIFGQGDTGKGTTAAWLALRLSNELNLRVLIVDFEGNPGEWQPRLQSLGYADSDAIQYYEPAHAPLWDQVADLTNAANRAEADFIIVDSIAMACMADTSDGNTQPPANYKSAIDQIGLPVLSLAHIPKSTTEPKYPFGSIFWHNTARCTWRIDALESTPGNGTVPSRKVTLTNFKRNDGQKPPKQLIEIIYASGPTGLPITLEVATYHETQAKRFAQIIGAHGSPMTPTEIATAYNDELDPQDENAKQLNARDVAKVLKRHDHSTTRKTARFKTEPDGKWTLT